MDRHAAAEPEQTDKDSGQTMHHLLLFAGFSLSIQIMAAERSVSSVAGILFPAVLRQVWGDCGDIVFFFCILRIATDRKVNLLQSVSRS
jgi:hypothetical protein